MLDIKWIRENPELFDEGMRKRSSDIKAVDLFVLDDRRREHIGALQDAQTRRNAASKEIGAAMQSGNPELAEKLKAEISEIKQFIQSGENTERELTDRKSVV